MKLSSTWGFGANVPFRESLFLCGTSSRSEEGLQVLELHIWFLVQNIACSFFRFFNSYIRAGFQHRFRLRVKQWSARSDFFSVWDCWWIMDGQVVERWWFLSDVVSFIAFSDVSPRSLDCRRFVAGDGLGRCLCSKPSAVSRDIGDWPYATWTRCVFTLLRSLRLSSYAHICDQILF